MGYTTTFKGELKFTCEMTAPMLSKINKYFGEDTNEFPELGLDRRNGGYIDLMMLKDFSGIKWDDATEKTYNLEKIVDAIIMVMRSEYPQFGLSGSMLAQGEDIDDRWELYIDEAGSARKRVIPTQGTKVTCPHCKRSFHI